MTMPILALGPNQPIEQTSLISRKSSYVKESPSI